MARDATLTEKNNNTTEMYVRQGITSKTMVGAVTRGTHSFDWPLLPVAAITANQENRWPVTVKI